MLDAIAIAGQVLVGRGLGAGDTERAYEASARMIWLSVYAGIGFAAVLLALEGVLPYAFTSDELVVERTQAIWLLFALMQPLNGAVFALDGILIGASDGPFLAWSMVGAFAASAAVSAGGDRLRLGHRRRVGGALRPDRRPARADVVALRRSPLARHGLGLGLERAQSRTAARARREIRHRGSSDADRNDQARRHDRSTTTAS